MQFLKSDGPDAGAKENAAKVVSFVADIEAHKVFGYANKSPDACSQNCYR